MATIDLVDALSDRFSGEVLAPAQPGYDEARRVFSAMIDRRPAVIARCADTADVTAAVDVARERGLALSIMGQAGAPEKTPDACRQELFDLRMRRSDSIDDRHLVDLGSPWVIGRYLFDKPRAPLYELARSPTVWVRRTAIVSTLYFVRQGDVDDVRDR